MAGGIIGLPGFQPFKPQGLGSYYGTDINKFGEDIGLSDNYGQQIKDALDKYYANQLQTSMQSANESAVAGGDFNPELSKYYATQGAKNAMTTGGIKGLEAGRADELNRVNLISQAFNDRLKQQGLDFQKKQYDDSQAFDIGDIAGFASSFVPLLLSEGGEVTSAKAKKILTDGSVKGHPLTDAQKRYFGWIAGGRKPRKMAGGGQVDHEHIGFQHLEAMLKAKGASNPGGLARYIGEKKYGKAGFKALQHKAGGGDVKDSNYFQEMFDGGIPATEVNSSPESTGDNTLIKAQSGEVIQSNPAGDLVGRDNLKLINEAGQMANNLFGDTSNQLGNLANPNRGQQLGNAILPLATKFKDFIGGLNMGASQAKPAGYQTGGSVDDPFGIKELEQQLEQMNEQARQNPNLTKDPNFVKGMTDIYNNLTARRKQQESELQRQEMIKQNQQEGAGVQQQQPPKKKITIESQG